MITVYVDNDEVDRNDNHDDNEYNAKSTMQCGI